MGAVLEHYYVIYIYRLGERLAVLSFFRHISTSLILEGCYLVTRRLVNNSFVSERELRFLELCLRNKVLYVNILHLWYQQPHVSTFLFNNSNEEFQHDDYYLNKNEVLYCICSEYRQCEIMNVENKPLFCITKLLDAPFLFDLSVPQKVLYESLRLISLLTTWNNILISWLAKFVIWNQCKFLRTQSHRSHYKFICFGS